MNRALTPFCFLILFQVAFISCQTNTQTEQTESPESESVTEDLDIASADAMDGDQYEKLISVSKNGGSVSKELYPMLGLDTIDYDGPIDDPYASFTKPFRTGEFDVFIFSRMGGCGVIVCGWEFLIAAGYNNHINDKKIISDEFQSKPNIAFLHEAFIVLSEIQSQFEENEAGAMEEVGEPEEVMLCIVVNNGRVDHLNELSKENLRFLRNRIFAMYGLKFKSEDLQKYYAQFDWYNPRFDNVDNQLTEVDKKIIQLHLEAEKVK